jgi:hypothetical protein
MLPPDGRAVLVEILRPPPGSELVRGVATTFTLDMTSALAAPLAFASHRLGTGNDPIAVTQAIMQASKHLDIFCQAGQIIVPPSASDLVGFLEDMVHPVSSPHPGGLFHPKIWLLEFSDGSETQFRLLCTSRNLTSDTSWDVVVKLDGVRGPRPLASNNPLRDLTLRLPDWATPPLPVHRAARIRELAESIRYAVWEHPEHVRNVTFHALGVTRRQSSLDFTGTRHLVISPFATDEGLERVSPSTSQSVHVVSRIEDLERLSPDTLKRLSGSFVIDDFATLERDDDPTPRTGLLTGLHAKTYVVEQGRDAWILLGSANATRAAFDGNIEFLVELSGPKTKIGIDTFLGPEAPFRTMLTEYVAQGGEEESEDNAADYRLQSALRSAATIRFAEDVQKDNNGCYTVHITSRDQLRLPLDITATVGLLTMPGLVSDLDTTVKTTFSGLAIVDITPFLVLRVTDAREETKSTLVQAELTGDPPGRRDELLARQFDTMEKFLHFLALLLALGSPGNMTAPLGPNASAGGWSAAELGVFEALLRALGSPSSALAELEPLVERLRKTEKGRPQILPPGFDDLWDLVWAAHRTMAEGSS